MGVGCGTGKGGPIRRRNRRRRRAARAGAGGLGRRALCGSTQAERHSERLPAASTASTRYSYVDPQSRPVSAAAGSDDDWTRSRSGRRRSRPRRRCPTMRSRRGRRHPVSSPSGKAVRRGRRLQVVAGGGRDVAGRPAGDVVPGDRSRRRRDPRLARLPQLRLRVRLLLRRGLLALLGRPIGLDHDVVAGTPRRRSTRPRRTKTSSA